MACGGRPAAAGLSIRAIKWRTADTTEITGAQRAALYAAGMLSLERATTFKSAVESIGPDALLLIRATSGTGVGWTQEAYFVLPLGEAIPTISWRALAQDAVGDSAYIPGVRAYDVEGCLSVAVGRGVFYHLSVPPNNEDAAAVAKDSLALASGFYEWRPGHHDFRFAGAADSSAVVTCEGSSK